MAGMANHLKNIFVGAGSVITKTPDAVSMIDGTHWMGAVYGIEKILGVTDNPVRRTFNHAGDILAEQFKKSKLKTQIKYIMTVMDKGEVAGLFIGDREEFAEAAKLSQELNITTLDAPLQRVVVYADPDEFHSTWVANKAVYRTRMAIADGGELLIVAPGLKRFGEEEVDDRLIREHGYRGTKVIKPIFEGDARLREYLSAGAHLIHGSSEDRFSITYAPGHLNHEEIEGVGYGYCDLSELTSWMPDGFSYNTLANKEEGTYKGKDGQPFYLILKPGQGLWKLAS